MPLHDWTQVESGIYHNFHHSWIAEIKDALNGKLLPPDYYAMAEQVAEGFGPDVLTLQDTHDKSATGGTATLPKPKTSQSFQLIGGVKPRLKSQIAVRHVSGDRVVAIIEVISPGNKSSTNALRSFLEKVGEFLSRKIHLLILDPFPPTPRDPNGIHGVIWEEFANQNYELPSTTPITFVSYEAADNTNAFVEPIAFGQPLPDMPLYLAPESYLMVPLEQTYNAAWEKVPARWKRVIAPSN